MSLQPWNRFALAFPFRSWGWIPRTERNLKDQVIRYSDREKITFSRGRVGPKNDYPYVEQKNWSVIRRLVGCGRYANQSHVNQFFVAQKLVTKLREGNKVKKICEHSKMPYQRVRDSAEVSVEAKRKLGAIHFKQDVVDLN